MTIILYILSVLSVIGTLVPTHDSKYWLVRGQANFRAYYLVVNLALLVSMIGMVTVSVYMVVVSFALAYCILVSLRTIFPYSRLTFKSVADAGDIVGRDVKFMIHNVYQHNEKYDEVCDLIVETDADVVLLLEVNEAWAARIKGVVGDVYPNRIGEIREDTYGILLLSKVEWKEAAVEHLVSDDIPSITAQWSIGGERLRVLGLHPEPPIPGEVLYSTPKDKEMVAAAKYLESIPEEEHRLLIGDLNDVAWSKASKAFRQETGMKDPREGRGFYSTFPAYSPLRIPLDHIFCDTSLRLVDLQTLSAAGSDHLAVSVTLRIPNKDLNYRSVTTRTKEALEL